MTDTNMTNLENSLIRFFTTLYFMIYVGNFIMTFVLDSVHRYDNVFLILGIQNINRNINISNSISSYIIWNWIFLIAIISINMYICVTFYTLYLNVSFTKIMVQIPIDYMFFVFDVSYVICIRFIVLLKKYLDEWVEIVLKIKDRRVNDDEQCLKLFRLYQNILMVYNLYKDIYELLTLSHVVDKFVRTLLSLYIIIFKVKKYLISGSQTSPIYLANASFWLLKIGFLTIIHVICNERFYTAVEEAESACIQLMKNRNYTKSEERLYKRVKQMNRTFSKMSACGLFYVDATLILCLMGVITDYSVVLLQFTFL
ncbi:hypothetical protein SFRURICE_009315 [Spodoptera frugiperda]|nr:hypothetical protein SFRURICE_009315 [Spodoptera frugiperda]